MCVCACVCTIKQTKDTDCFWVNCHEEGTLAEILKIITSRDLEENIAYQEKDKTHATDWENSRHRRRMAGNPGGHE